LKSGKK